MLKKDGVYMIRLEKISKSYNHQGASFDVLKDISLEIKEGEVFGLVGDTGSGKSTMLRIMNGFIEVSSGEVYLFNELLNQQNKYKLVQETSMIFQSFNLLANLNVIENVMLPNKLRKLDKEATYKKALKLLEFVGLKDHLKAYPKTLSGGQKQRVAIARTLMSNPKIIFCDEPTSALDKNMANDILILLKNINEQFKTTIVIVSHDISVIKTICDKAAILENGNIVDIVTVNKVEHLNLTYSEALLK